MKTYTGFIPPVIEKEAYFLGASPVPTTVLQEDGQWDAYLPTDEFQWKNGTETSACVSFGTLNAVEILLKKLNESRNYSDRFLAKISETTVQGNDPQKVSECLRKIGTPLQDKWDFEDGMTLETFYETIPATLHAEAKKDFLDRYIFKHEWAFDADQPHDEKINNMKTALRYSPLGAAVQAWVKGPDGRYIKTSTENHWVCIYGYTDNAWKVLDTYDNTYKLYAMENTLNWVKRYYITTTGLTEVQGNVFMQILRAIGEALGLIQKQIDQLPKAPVAVPEAPVAPKYLWDTPEQARHSVRVMCDEAGLSVDDKNLICQVISCESGFKKGALGAPNHDGTRDYGICQMNSYWYIGKGKPIASIDEALNDPEKCVRVMLQRFKQGGLRDWECYKREFYKKFK